MCVCVCVLRRSHEHISHIEKKISNSKHFIFLDCDGCFEVILFFSTVSTEVLELKKTYYSF